ncbi:MAG: CapA family protein [Clostridiales bacterium]|nr:CapA family protein [Clostridiales bacterium]
MRKIACIFLMTLFLLTNVGCTCAEDLEISDVRIEEQSINKKAYEDDNSNEKADYLEEAEPVSIPDQYTYIKISAVGDVMVHSPQIRVQFNKENNAYDFTNNFQFIKPHISSSDLALANLETTFGGEDKGFAGFPFFNSPDELAYALKDAGFDVISTSNNHSFDTGKEGILRTIRILEENKLKVIGTRKNENLESFVVIDVNGIKVGLSAYTFETPMQGEYRAVNAIRMPKEVETIIDTFGFENLEDDLEKMKERIKTMKQRGADIIVFFMHWGNEYWREPCKYQKRIAQTLSNYGVDIIFGSHTHVIQPIEFVNSEFDGSQTVVAYSMGNILSNQRYETLGNKYTEDGVIVNVTLKKNTLTGEITLVETGIVPTWVHRYIKEGQRIYEIIPIMDALQDGEKFGIYFEKTMRRIENSLARTLEVIDVEENEIIIEPLLADK